MKELESSQETQEQRRKRMENRAQELKNKREAMRLEFVKEKRRQRFREECDELREAEAKLNFLKTADDRFEQIEENKEKKLIEQEGMFNECVSDVL